MGFGKTGLGTIGNSSTDSQARQDITNLTSQLSDIAVVSLLDKRFNVKIDGTDTTVAFKSVLDYAVTNKLRVLVPPATYTVANLNIPSGSDIYFLIGSKMKLVPNSPIDTSCVKLSSVQNINITGLLEIDGNMSTITSGNEHMHGLFIYNAVNVFIDTVYSHDCYGDNVSISGGSDNAGDYSNNINIKNIRAFKAGRKNLVIEQANNVNIQVAKLDNSTGSVNGTGGNSLDIEPFSYTGTKDKFNVNLGDVTTIGCGNDMTVGTTLTMSEGFVVNINNLDCTILDLPNNDTALNASGWKTAIFSYGITLNVNNFIARLASTRTDLGGGVFTNPTKAIWVQHGALINIGNMKVYGGCSNSSVVRIELGADVPTVKIKSLLLSCPLSYGIAVERGNLYVDDFKVVSLADKAIFCDTVSDNIIKIGSLDVNNSCATGVLSLTSGTTVTTASIILESIRIVDTRTTKLTYFIQSDNKDVMKIMKLGAIDIQTGINFISMNGVLGTNSDFYIKTLNSSPLGSIIYVFNNPQSIVTTDKGTIAINKSGAAGAIFYVKETDGVNTGWRAL